MILYAKVNREANKMADKIENNKKFRRLIWMVTISGFVIFPLIMNLSSIILAIKGIR